MDLVQCSKATMLSCHPATKSEWGISGCQHAGPHLPMAGCGCYCPLYGGFQVDIPIPGSDKETKETRCQN